MQRTPKTQTMMTTTISKGDARNASLRSRTMRSRMILKLTFALSVAVTGVDGSLAAQTQEKSFVSLDRVIAEARRRRPGRLLEVELERTGGQDIYEVEILGDNRVVYKLRFNAVTLEFLGEKEE